MWISRQLNSMLRFGLTVIIFSLILICGGCGTGQGELFPALTEPLYWPDPPEIPRIKYVGQLSSQDDLKSEVSSMEAFGRLVFGRELIGVFARPHAITIDEDDRLYIADTAGGVVHIMGLKSREYIQFNDLIGDQRLISPIGVVVAGDAPENADRFVRFIKRKTTPKDTFQHCAFAVLGLGDTNYDQFCAGELSGLCRIKRGER